MRYRDLRRRQKSATRPAPATTKGSARRKANSGVRLATKAAHSFHAFGNIGGPVQISQKATIAVSVGSATAAEPDGGERQLWRYSSANRQVGLVCKEDRNRCAGSSSTHHGDRHDGDSDPQRRLYTETSIQTLRYSSPWCIKVRGSRCQSRRCPSAGAGGGWVARTPVPVQTTATEVGSTWPRLFVLARRFWPV